MLSQYSQRIVDHARFAGNFAVLLVILLRVVPVNENQFADRDGPATLVLLAKLRGGEAYAVAGRGRRAKLVIAKRVGGLLMASAFPLLEQLLVAHQTAR